jgi:serine/threonine protein kinase
MFAFHTSCRRRYAGVVHRDVKPDNILFAQAGGLLGGGKPKIKLIDLGAAADLRVVGLCKLNAADP